MLNAQSLRHHSMLAKIGRAMREAVTKAADRPAGAQVTVRNAKGRVTLVVKYSRLIGGLNARRSGFQFFDYTADLIPMPAPDITPLVLSVLREHGDVADALPAKPAMVTPEDLPASLLLDLLPVDTHGREAFPYGRAALGLRADVPFTCGGAR